MFLHTKEDTRMPCRAVTTWSSPYTSDDHFSTMPTTGLYGAGTVFASPLQSNYPMMSIGLSPGTFGVHLYQKPDVLPRFQTTSLESASSPEVSLLDKMSVSTSSVYALPDVSESHFTCGLAPIRLPTSSFLSTADLSQIGYGDDDLSGVLCVVTMTSKGDIYAHSLLESKACFRRSEPHEGLPLGTSAVRVPTTTTNLPSVPGRLNVTLSNQYALPREAIAPPPAIDTTILGLPSAMPPPPPTTTTPPAAGTVTLSACTPIAVRGDYKDESYARPSFSTLPETPMLDNFDHAIEPRVKDEVERSDVTSAFLQKVADKWTGEDLNVETDEDGDEKDDSSDVDPISGIL
jgi:hypothetical protein